MYILIDYYTYYNNNLEFDAPEIHDVALKNEITSPHGDTTC